MTESGDLIMDIPRVLGTEIRRRIEGMSNDVSVEIAIHPASDLRIAETVNFKVTIPSDYQSRGGCRVVLENPSKHQSVYTGTSQMVLDGEITFPWLTSTTYPLPTWFYTIRRSLRKQGPAASTLMWMTPVTLQHIFRKPLMQSGKTRASDLILRVGAGRTQGRRSYMEDTDFSFSSINCGSASIGLHGVLDGHGGADCALFVAEELPSKIAVMMRTAIGVKKKQSAYGPNDTNDNYAEVLFRCFLETDAEYLRTSRSNAGSTANVVLWDGVTGMCYLANVGDTRTVVCSKGRIAVDATQDRKATAPEEIARVARNGGFVANGRVNGTLAVSRAFGDKQLKQGAVTDAVAVKSVTEPNTAVTPAPDITHYCPRSGDEFLVLATDGLWDVMTSQEAVDWVVAKATTAGLLGSSGTDFLQNETASKAELSRLADELAHNAVKLGSMDNVTVMLIFFDRSDTDDRLAELGDEKWTKNKAETENENETWVTERDVSIGSHEGYSSIKQSSAPAPTFKSYSSGHSLSRSKPQVLNRVNGSHKKLLDVLEKSRTPDTFSYTPVVAVPQAKHDARAKASAGLDDDMMDFLLDDSNF